MNTNNEHLKAKMEQIQGGIMHLLNLSEEQYKTFQLRCGRAFLQNYMPKYPDLIDEVLQKENYWKWWSNLYLLRDEAFLSTEKIELINPIILQSMYSYLHNPYTLIGEIVVDSIIFEGTAITQKPAL